MYRGYLAKSNSQLVENRFPFNKPSNYRNIIVFSLKRQFTFIINVKLQAPIQNASNTNAGN